MSEGQAWLHLVEFSESQERVTIYRDGDTHDWNIEWFNKQGGYKFVSGPILIELVEKLL